MKILKYLNVEFKKLQCTLYRYKTSNKVQLIITYLKKYKRTEK